MTKLFRRGQTVSAIEDERELLRRAREQAATELEAMKRELAERIRAVTDRETELSAALAGRRHDHPAARPSEQPAPESSPDNEVDRERIEQRLAELREAERQFLRTQDELATRSEALAARERRIAERERKAVPDVRAAHARTGYSDTRAPQIEPAGRSSPEAPSFSDGLESLRRRGTRGRPS